MSESFLNDRVELHCGDCRDVLATLAENSIDACVTDPPYHLTSIVQRFGSEAGAAFARMSRGFMGKVWDGGDVAFRPETWAAVYRVLKPGAHLIACGGTRTFHRLACAIEDAGFEIRDTVSWLYGSGFPKSHDVSKGIDRAAGAEREVVGNRDRYRDGRARQNLGNTGGEFLGLANGVDAVTAPASAAARQWDGWGTALKPAHEISAVAMKPLACSEYFAILLSHISERLRAWLDLNASDAAMSFSDFQVRLREAENSVLGHARMSVLANIEPALCVVVNSISVVLASSEQQKTKADIVQLHARPSSRNRMSDQQTTDGAAVDISIRIMDMCTSVAMGEPSPNIVSSWQNISGDLLREANKFTIETASRLTTALRILNCSLPPNIGAGIGNLSPDCELIVLARKPLSEGTVAANVLRWGTGAINVDGCRVEGPGVLRSTGNGQRERADGYRMQGGVIGGSELGRWPANLVHDGSDEVVAAFPETTSGDLSKKSAMKGWGYKAVDEFQYTGDSGSAARFFYTAKADADDRLGSKHPTVKPLDLMQWLVRLVTPKGGLVLDQFAGTGTTGEAAWREGMRAVLIEAEPEYQADIRRRMALVLAGPDERQRESIKAKGLPIEDGPLFSFGQEGST